MQYKNHSFIIDIELYDFKVHVLHDFSDEEFQEYILGNFDLDEITRRTSTATCWTIYNKNGKPDFAIDFRKRLKRDGYSFNTIVHESTHVALDIFNHIKVPHTHDITDEAFCPLCAYIAGKVYTGLFER